MLTETIAGFLGLSLFLYCVLAGADFGAGILELFVRGNGERSRGERETISRAIAPVWEANHVWIILALVILFTGFPAAYSLLSIYFHIPITLMLVGIVLRGCAFTFRHYDAIRDRSQRYYSMIFVASSVLTPLVLGMIVGGLIAGRVSLADGSYYARYLAPWLRAFSASLGLFVCSLFTFVAAVYLTGEARSPEIRRVFVERARWANIGAIVSGVLVLVTAYVEGVPLVDRFFASRLALSFMVVATLLLVPLWRGIMGNRVVLPRVLAAAQVGFVLLGWFALQFPVLVATQDPATTLTIYNAAAPRATMLQLLYALIGGSLLIFPAMGYLFRVFKREA